MATIEVATATADVPPAESIALTLTLRILGSKEGSTDLQAPANCKGSELKKLLQDVVALETRRCASSSKMARGIAAKLVLDDAKTLEEQGVEDEAMITVRAAEQYAASPESSFLRQSIAKNGTSSYYYAHANEKALPAEHRYVYGGEPAKLESSEAAVEAERPAIAIKTYSWSDEGDFVCIYISAEGEPKALEAARDGKNDEVSVTFETKSLQLLIEDASSSSSLRFALNLRSLENEILPEESKYRVSSGKRITLKLKKRR
eukprot:CAMPEP_0206476986 /NCGR_PEP_ID=MMETSP0324_2-20121206/35070_1 /ASSEMBLY_ACC=CAM_ASM_000836 /TAXON_ID=2866 /ORGANISM="Crypthecodinium cohnii, Strain Seligo" /LENGTH=260 /DNA_ID=CAMNT_0053952777 /DNA_START=149 /DNA_END=926 /DNA_ORIENTATION=+